MEMIPRQSATVPLRIIILDAILRPAYTNENNYIIYYIVLSPHH